MWALFKAYEEERVWKEIGDRLIGYRFGVTITLWNTHTVVKINKSCYPSRLNDTTI
jgi:hypothetical protein